MHDPLDMSVNIAGVTLKNPVMTASGTFGFGAEYSEYYDLSKLGAITMKGITLNARSGNPPPRVAETPLGMLNSVGLQNPGIDFFIKRHLPFLKRIDVRVLANIAGNTISEYCEMAERLSDTAVDIIEMNVSCPNVREGGIAFGVQPDILRRVVSEVKKHAKQPVCVKLSPNVTDICEMARAAEDAGADALSLINTLLGMRIDIHKRKPLLGNVTGGLSGPAVFPVAVRMVYAVRGVTKLPIIGMGGISTGADAVEMMLAGANAVSVGTANFVDPMTPLKVITGIYDYMEKNGIACANALSGLAQPDGRTG